LSITVDGYSVLVYWFVYIMAERHMSAMWLVHNRKIQFVHHRRQCAFVRKSSRWMF